MRALIISGGTPPNERILKEEIEKCQLLLGADSGCETYFKYNIIPDYALGDFDSIKQEVKEKLKLTNVIEFNSEKDNTDSEIAVLKAIELGAKEIVLLGFTGTRIDHTLSNLGLLNICLKNNVKAYIRDNNNIIWLVDKSITLKGNKGTYISFQAFGEDVEEFSIKGAKYELEDYTLTFGDGRCVSNEFLMEDIEINFKKGKILIIYSND